MQTIGELRAGYGQGVLDDAARDPILDRVLNIYADEIAAVLREPKPGQAGRRPLDVLVVTSYANGYVDSMSEPGRRPRETRPYGGYSPDMLTIAALCRLADRLPTVVLPAAAPRPAATGWP